MSPLLIVMFVLGGIGAGYAVRKYYTEQGVKNVESSIQEKLQRADEQTKKLVIDAKDKAVTILQNAEQEIKEEKNQLHKNQERLLNKEVLLEERTKRLEQKEEKLVEQIEKVKTIKEDLEQRQEKELALLEERAKLSREEAKQYLLDQIQKTYEQDLFDSLRRLEKDRQDQIEHRAAELVATVIQRYSRSHVAEITTSSVALPNDEIKGRIIGKEGRNIRHFEQVTGVEVIIDDVPDTITLSCFDPVRREVARIALEHLVQDGRIQPSRIEEFVEDAKKDVMQKIKEAGENAVYEAGIIDFPPEIVHLLGRLAFRTSYGQNVLMHSIEIATLCSMMAQELGMNVEIAKKAGMVHDIGKAVDHEIEGSHLELGIKILQKYKVDERIVLAMRSHHDDYPVAIPEAYIVNAADAISAARPGARRESLENYIKRLTDLEKIALEFRGVEKAYAIQAGRELRVFVTPQQVTDFESAQLARDIAVRIQEELKFPGEIKVVVIRESRAIEYAR